MRFLRGLFSRRGISVLPVVEGRSNNTNEHQNSIQQSASQAAQSSTRTVDEILTSLSSNAQDLVKIAPPKNEASVSKPSFGQRFGLWRSKLSTKPKEVKVELVSFQDQGINSLVVNGELKTIQEAQTLLKTKSSEYKGTNLEVVLKSLDFGSELKAKGESQKIGSKLYQDNEGQVFSDKAKRNKIATIGFDTKYIDNAREDLKALEQSISFDKLQNVETVLQDYSKTCKDVVAKVQEVQKLSVLDEGLVVKVRERASNMEKLASKLKDINIQASTSFGFSSDQLAFLKTETPEDSKTQLGSLITSLEKPGGGMKLDSLDLLAQKVEGKALDGKNQEKLDDLKTRLTKKAELSDKPKLRKALQENLTTLKTSFELQGSQSINELRGFLEQYSNMKDSLLSLKASGTLKLRDEKVFDQIDQSISKNAEVLIGLYADKLKDLDYQDLTQELVFLKSVTTTIPELDRTQDICLDLVDFAEQIGLEQEGQMSTLSKDLKSKILNHYDAGTLARSQSESFEQAVSRDKSQQVFYSKTLLNSIDDKLTDKGVKNMKVVSKTLKDLLSGDYSLIKAYTSSLKNPSDPSGIFLDDYTKRFAEVGVEIKFGSSPREVEIEKTKISLDSQIRSAKHYLISDTKIDLNSFDSIKLSESIKAMKGSGVDKKLQNLDLLFVSAALCEIKLATLDQLSKEEDKSPENEKEIFVQKVADFIKDIKDTKLDLQNNSAFQEMGLDPKKVKQADIIMSLAEKGFSDFKTLDKSLQSINVTAKAFSLDDNVKDMLTKQFMRSDIDLIAREMRSNAMTKLFEVGYVSTNVTQAEKQSQMSSMLLDSSALKNKMEGFYQELDSDKSLEKRSAEPIKGVKLGRFLTNIVSGSSSLKSPDPEVGKVTINNVGTAFEQLRTNNAELESLLAQPAGVRSTEAQEKIKKCQQFEKKILGLVSGNTKNTMQLVHMSILDGYEQFKTNNEDKNFEDYLQELKNPESNLRTDLEKKFKIETKPNPQTLLDTQIRTLTYMEPKERMEEMIKWYDDIHIDVKDKLLKTEIDAKKALTGEKHLFSSIDGQLSKMNPGDEFVIDKTGKLTVKTDQELVKLAQEAVTEGALEAEVEVSVTKKDGLKVIKEENGYSVLINGKLGAEFGFGLSTAMGLAESKLLMSGGIEKGHKITFGNTPEQQKELHQFLSKVFTSPGLVVEDLARAESIFIENGKEAKIGFEASIGLPSVINSIAVATNVIPDDKEVTDVRNKATESASKSARAGKKASASHKTIRETRRGEQIITKTYRSEQEFVGSKSIESLMKKVVAESSLNSHYTATSKTTERHGFITDHIITTSMNIKTPNSQISQSDRSMLALSGLLKKGSYEYDVLMKDETLKSSIEEKLETLKESMQDAIPTVIV
ncbi:hypothetical protein OAP83_01300 [Rickettsiales bacterium]|nr:hypothetical protein [Rickettsiales bacterium]